MLERESYPDDRRLIYAFAVSVLPEMLSEEDDFYANFTIPSDWSYRGEGNCNVVISLPKTRKIVRIRKTERPQSLIRWLIIWITDFFYWYCGRNVKEELRDLQFYSTVMRPLLGRRYTSEAHPVILSRKQVRYLEEKLCKLRPDFRSNKVLQFGRASLHDDFAFISQDEYEYLPFKMFPDVFAIELKPKQGWRPLSEKHFPACLFCMHQYHKLENRQIGKLSRYCPEDLFSGNEARMKKAITSLIEVPQNNFRIFKNGMFVYGQGSTIDISDILKEFFDNSEECSASLLDEFSEIISRCLLTNLMNYDSTEDCEEKLFCKWNAIIQESNSANCLPPGCVLEKILSVQMLDNEGSSFYYKLLNGETEQDWDYVDMLVSKLNSKRLCLKCTVMMLGSTNRREEERDLAFVPYLISAIAKDCSLMITLKRIVEDISDDLEVKNIIRSKYGCFLINIGVFDLYPKPLSTIRKHWKRNEKILQAYMRAVSK